MAQCCTKQVVGYLKAPCFLKLCPKSVAQDVALVCAGEALGCSFQPSTPSEAKLSGVCVPTVPPALQLHCLTGHCSSGGAENLQVSSAPCKGDGRHLAPKQTALCCFVFDSALPNNRVAKGSNTAIHLPFPKTPNGIYHIIDV